MYYAFLITLRGGLETFMFFGVLIAYLRATGRGRLVGTIRFALVASVFVCLTVGYLVSRASNQGLLQGPAALGATAIAIWLIFVVRKERALPEGLLQTPSPATVFLVALYMCSWNGIQFAVFGFQIAEAPRFLAGWAVGLLTGALVAVTFVVSARLVSRGVLTGATIVFLLIFAFELVIQGGHMAAEVEQLPFSTFIHDNTEIVGPESWIGRYLDYSLGIAPFLGCLLWRLKEGLALNAAKILQPVDRA